MQQWLTLYKDLIGSPYNPRSSAGGKSPYPKSPPNDHQAPSSEPGQYVKRKLIPNATQQRFITSPHVSNTQHTTHSSLKQHDGPASTTKDVRFSNPPGVPF